MKKKINNFISGSNALKLDDTFYEIVSNNHNRFKSFNTNSNIPIQSNIFMIQQIYLDLIDNDEINLLGVNIKFSEDIWDFSSLQKEGKSISLFTFNFSSNEVEFSLCTKNILKLYVMYMITEYGLYRSSNKSDFRVIIQVFEYMTKNDILSIENMTPNRYKLFFDEQNVQYNTIVKKKSSLKTFYTFYSLIAEDIYTKELNEYLVDRDLSTMKALEEQNKTPLLPTDFYKDYTNLLLEYIYDDTNMLNERALAGLLYIGSQTGLRITELCLLTKDCLQESNYKDIHIGVLNYRSTKNGGTKNEIYTEGTTNASEKVIQVINYLNNLFTPYRKDDCEFLVFNFDCNKRNSLKKRQKKNNYLITGTSIEIFNKKFCIKYRTKLNSLNRKDQESFETNLDGKILNENFNEMYVYYGLKEDDVISVPSIRQFRVYFASDLSERGVDHKTISYLLNHKTEDMWGYYVRPKHKVQEDIDFSKEVVKEIIQDNTKILGPKGEAIKEKIDDLIKENNFNVVEDFDAIIDLVCNEMPIRAKEGGFCIKSNPRRQCRHDANTDEFLCAYGCCPNHCHFYFAASITYQKCLNIKKCVDYNLEQEYINQAQKELYKLEAIIKQELSPEMIELENEINKKTGDKVKELHPDLTYLVDNLEKVKEEINVWTTQIQEMKQS